MRNDLNAIAIYQHLYSCGLRMHIVHATALSVVMASECTLTYPLTTQQLFEPHSHTYMQSLNPTRTAVISTRTLPPVCVASAK